MGERMRWSYLHGQVDEMLPGWTSGGWRKGLMGNGRDALMGEWRMGPGGAKGLRPVWARGG